MYRTFQVSGIVCAVASAVLLVLLPIALLGGTNNLVIPTWAITTLVGLLFSGLGLLALIIHIVISALHHDVSDTSPPRSLRWALVLLACCLGFAPLDTPVVQTVFSWERIHRVRVVNQSDAVIQSVRLEGGYDHEFGPLEPNAARQHKFRIKREGELVVVAFGDDEPSRLVLDDWVHPDKGAGRNRTIIIQPDGSLSADED